MTTQHPADREPQPEPLTAEEAPLRVENTPEDRAYNRGWLDGNAAGLDACQPVIDSLQARLALVARLPVSGESEGLREAVEDAITLLEAAPTYLWSAGEPDETIDALRAALTRSSEARTDGPESVSPGGDVPQSDGPVVDEPAATDSDPLERARVLIETIAAASAELATLYGPLWHLTRSSEARTEPEAEGE